MQALEVLFPVFFMLFLGYLSRKMNFISYEQNEGAKNLVLNILFPFLVYDVLVGAKITSNFLINIFSVDACWIIIYLVSRKLTKFTGEKYAHISSFMLMTSEGGNVALPLYLTLVSASNAINTVTFDVGGILINFGLVPAIIAKQTSGKIGVWNLTKKIFSSSFMIAVLLGLAANLTGFHRLVMASQFGSIYTNTMKLTVGPIMGIILFTIGYELKFERKFLKPVLRLAVVRLLGCGLIIAGFFLFFPTLMQNQAFRIGVLLYFMCPTGFPVPLQVQPLVKNRDDETFMSAFISLFMIIALIAYTLIVIFK
ncbi:MULTISPECIES: AEC family transporter [Lactobacillus]|uniref:Transporter n=1 Tax=Lactobacillus xujianguonis TaxID=2495899 RepID=A0A437SV35_9LACO|nr:MULTISPECIES: transporter [Lactobacillus]RVU70803.1 transporter [Lactobacillus xujianguonis]RVU77005.1 transporter [Lactobacillus xujianguonis]